MVQKSIGQVLKERRTLLDWSLAQAEKQTKIKRIYISALETDNHAVLPGDFYVRAYLKQYADKLDLDAAALLEALDTKGFVEVEGPFEDTGNYRFIRPDQRIPERPEQLTFANGELSEGEGIQTGTIRKYLPMILLSSVAVLILLLVGGVIAFSFVNTNKDLSETGNFTVASKATSSSSSASVLSYSTNGANLTIQVKKTSNPTSLNLSLTNTTSQAVVNLTNSNISNVTLSADNPSATASINSNAASSNLSLSSPNLISLVVNGVSVPNNQLQNIATITIEIGN